MDAWSRRGNRYEEGELGHGGFLPYLTLCPTETPEEALSSLEAVAASQDTDFVPLKASEEPGTATEANNVSGERRIPVFAGQDLSPEVKQVVQAIVRDNSPPGSLRTIAPRPPGS